MSLFSDLKIKLSIFLVSPFSYICLIFSLAINKHEALFGQCFSKVMIQMSSDFIQILHRFLK